MQIDELEEIAAQRAERHAEEAARLAKEAVEEARRAEHARDLAEVRRHIAEERAVREQKRQALLRSEAEKPPVDELALERDLLSAAQAQRRTERDRLAAEAIQVAAERAALDAADAAAVIREEENRQALLTLQIEREQAAAEQAAVAAAMQRELDEIDQRLEERASVRSAIAARAAGKVALAQTGVKRKSRMRVSASVLIDQSGTLLALPLVNISLTGALVSMSQSELPALRVGLMLFITVFATEEVHRQVDLTARVVRMTDRDIALDWTADRAAAYDLARLIDELSQTE